MKKTEEELLPEWSAGRQLCFLMKAQRKRPRGHCSEPDLKHMSANLLECNFVIGTYFLENKYLQHFSN